MSFIKYNHKGLMITYITGQNYINITVLKTATGELVFLNKGD